MKEFRNHWHRAVDSKLVGGSVRLCEHPVSIQVSLHKTVISYKGKRDKFFIYFGEKRKKKE